MTMTKTQEVVEQDGKLILRTSTEESVEVTAEEVEKLDEQKQREILYLENDVRVLQARLAALQGEKTKTVDLASTARALRPKVEVKEELEKPLK
jgi:3-phenylpropionate/cinnamic acid dioxygenase small subunit